MGQSTPIPPKPTTPATLGDRDQHIAIIREMLELPEEAAFCGYLIHRDEEYLHETSDSLDETARAFVPTPQLAQQFQSYDEARRLAQSDRGETVAIMFTLDGDVIVAGMAGVSECDDETLH